MFGGDSRSTRVTGLDALGNLYLCYAELTMTGEADSTMDTTRQSSEFMLTRKNDLTCVDDKILSWRKRDYLGRQRLFGDLYITKRAYATGSVKLQSSCTSETVKRPSSCNAGAVEMISACTSLKIRLSEFNKELISGVSCKVWRKITNMGS